MTRLTGRVIKFEQKAPRQHAHYVLMFRPGESVEDAIARYQREGKPLADRYCVMPEPCETVEEWERLYAKRDGVGTE